MASGKSYPQYQIRSGTAKTFVPESAAARQISDGDAKLGTRVQESDGTTRQMTQGEIKKIKTLADEWAMM